jgi:Xaa-Pro aminopeptidase/Xaa-Pro dipeptidase
VKARRKRLEKYCNSVNCDTLVTFEPENLFYLTGFWGEAVGILENSGQTIIIAPELEAGRAKDESINCDVITSQRGGLISTLASLKKKKSVLTVTIIL